MSNQNIDKFFWSHRNEAMFSIPILYSLINGDSYDDFIHNPDTLAYLNAIDPGYKGGDPTVEAVYKKWYDAFKQVPVDYRRTLLQETISRFNFSGSNKPFNCSFYEDYAKIIGLLANYYDCKTVYNPFAGRATISRFLPEDCSYIGQEIMPLNYEIARYQLKLLGRIGYTIFKEDSLLPPMEEYDMVASAMPWGRMSTGGTFEEYYLKTSALVCKKNAIGFYPESILFRTGQCASIRKQLLKEDAVDCVIKLPSRILWPETGVQTCIVIINYNKVHKGHIRFIDASSFVSSKESTVNLDWERLASYITGSQTDETFVRVVDKESVAKRGVWSVEKYFEKELKKPEGYRAVALIKILDEVRRSHSPESRMVPLYQIADLASSPFDHTLGEEEACLSEYRNYYKYVDVPSILISKIQRLKPTAFNPLHGGVYINQNMAAFTIKKDVAISTQYLLNELGKDYVWKQLPYHGTTIPYISVHDFLEAKIFVPIDKEKQDIDVLQSIQKEQTLRDKVLSSELNVYLDEWGQRQHTLGHAVGDLDDIIDALKSARDANNGVLRDDDKIDTDGTTVKDYYLKLAYAKQRLATLVDHLADGIAWEEPDEIQLIDFIERYKKNHVQHGFVLEIVYSQEDSFLVRFAESRLLDVVENIISNCKKHGFTDNSVDYKIRVEIKSTTQNDKPAVSILFMNNGRELDPTMNPEKVFKYGESTTGGGLGGSRIKLSVRTYGGSVEFLKKEDLNVEGFNAAYKIVLPTF